MRVSHTFLILNRFIYDCPGKPKFEGSYKQLVNFSGYRLVCLEPIDAGSDLSGCRNAFRQGERVLHTTHYYRFNYLQLIPMGVENQFVVDLQKHFGSQTLFPELIVYPDHREFDHIRSRPLDRRIDSVSLRKAPDREIGRIDVLQPAFPPD